MQEMKYVTECDKVLSVVHGQGEDVICMLFHILISMIQQYIYMDLTMTANLEAVPY